MTSNNTLPKLKLESIDKTWTLFLDRDGVINNEIVGTYVLNWKEFVFSTNALAAIATFAQKFGRIFIVTNQKGVSKGLMSEMDLKEIHQNLVTEVELANGKIDRIYYCTDLDDHSFYRKPNPGMAFQAREDFPEIEFSKSIMVGNKPSDMRFGRSAGMYTVFITSTNPDQPFPHQDIDLRFPSLFAFAQAL